MIRVGEQVAAQGILLVMLHGAEIHVKDDKADHHNNSQKRIKVVGDCADKDGKPVLSLNKAGDGGGPGGNRGNDANGCGG